jgi:hypothetical protein
MKHIYLLAVTMRLNVRFIFQRSSDTSNVLIFLLKQHLLYFFSFILKHNPLKRIDVFEICIDLCMSRTWHQVEKQVVNFINNGIFSLVKTEWMYSHSRRCTVLYTTMLTLYKRSYFLRFFLLHQHHFDHRMQQQ